MSTNTCLKKPEETAEAPANEAKPAPAELHFELFELADTTPSRFTYYSRVLQTIAEAFASPYAALSVQEGSQVIEHDYCAPGADAEFWKSGVQGFLTEMLTEYGSRAKLLDSKDGDMKIALLGATITASSGRPIGAIALATSRRGRSDAAGKLTFLESLACVASCAVSWAEAKTDTRGSSMTGAAQALARGGTCGTPEELAFTITNSLRNKLGCEQVALGMVRRKWVNILAVSGLDRVAKQSASIRGMKAAMEECLDAGIAIASPDLGSESNGNTKSGYRLHQQWRAAVKGDAVASIPLRIGEDLAAVLCLRHRPDQPFTEEQLEQIRGHVEPYAAALRLLRKANRGPLRCARDAVGSALGSMVARGHIGRKVAVVLLAALAGWTVFGTMDYELTVSAVVQPRQTRHITAPFDGVLGAASALEGDVVTRGDVLCQFDQREVEQQRAEMVAEINVYERKKDQALAEDDPVSFQLALASQKLARAKLDTINTRIARCTIRAPIDGIIVSGDLRKSLGGVVQLGDPLFEIAPMQAMVLELQIPEADADELALDLSGTFASHARPEHARPFCITRIHPRTEVRTQGNMCIVEASADLAGTWMRPGMEGVAQVHVGRRHVWWIGLHRFLDYLRLKFWL
ncbi:MAG: HlyD family efflux transporter periplasmic adaptor subunit [Planctomycetota bacterium]